MLLERGIHQGPVSEVSRSAKRLFDIGYVHSFLSGGEASVDFAQSPNIIIVKTAL